MQLDDEAFARKIAAVSGYNAKLALDVEAALSGATFKGVRRFFEPQLRGDIDKALSATSLGRLAFISGD